VIIQCTACQARYHYDETRFAGAPAKRIKCTKCANVFEIRNPAMASPGANASARPSSIGPDEFSLDETAMTEASKRRQAGPIPGGPARTGMLASAAPGDTAGPSGPPPAGGQARTTDRVPIQPNTRNMARPLRLPDGVRLSLACISGPDSGRIFEVDKPRVVIGRANADIVVSDIQCSRQHAAIEVQDEHVFLVDLGSTNGTYVYDQRIGRTELESRTEFEIGTTTLMLIRSGGPHENQPPGS
jgi:predicted Zn finger-like uncharacterized protein